MSNKQPETQKEDGFMKPTDTDAKKELSDPRLGVITTDKKGKGGSFVGNPGLRLKR